MEDTIANTRTNTPSDLYLKLYESGFVDFIYYKYEFIAGGFPQGYCGQIAEEIQAIHGGELVAGWLDYGYGEREHWWLDIDGCIVDPMGEIFNMHTPCRHREAHRDISQKYW